MNKFDMTIVVKKYFSRLILKLFAIAICITLSDSPCLAETIESMTVSPSTYAQLPYWEQDDHSKALLAFKNSCVEILQRDANTIFNPSLQHRTTRQWQRVCQAAMKIHQPTSNNARQFFESWFVPYHVANQGNVKGIFTGYYLPLLHARLQPNKQFTVPIHALPQDLVKVDLSLFRSEFSGKTIIGQFKNNALFPYPDRKAIMEGVIEGKARILAWGNNAIDIYFAQVQGSAIVDLPDKHRFVIGYAGDNGRVYSSIGKILIARNQLTKQTVSMQSIRSWLTSHPDEMEALLNQNASYVFFKMLPDKNPLGTEKVPLTPERSLAIDNRYIPFGVPIWLTTAIPDKASASLVPYRHLLIAQDTGGAIRGVVRGDVYWGTGEKAAFIAGHMNSPGEYWVLLPAN
jgi:membrane-bound lytic murein transglycosylase A